VKATEAGPFDALLNSRDRASKLVRMRNRVALAAPLAAALSLGVSGQHAPKRVPVEMTYEVVASHPHDRDAFTQGLVFRRGVLYESTGLNGRSSLREVDLETGAVRRRVDVPEQYFAEGLAELGGRLYQLTWQTHHAFVYDTASFALTGGFAYEGEGWGLTDDGHSLVMSDGTNVIRFLDPATFAVRRTIQVSNAGVPVTNINELEYVDGQIYANIWMADTILRIDPKTGWVTATVDMRGLLPAGSGNADVLNGIAYDADHKRLFVTGKLWPRLFEVRFVPKPR
jgi:glutamine cyclotransferase